MTHTCSNQKTMGRRASANHAEARSACAKTNKTFAVLILDAIIMASIIITLITLALVLNLRLVLLVLVSLILAVRLVGNKGNPRKSRQTP